MAKSKWPRWYQMLETARAVADANDGLITSFGFRDELIRRRLIREEGTDASTAIQIASGWLVGLIRWQYVIRTDLKTEAPEGRAARSVRIYKLTSFGVRYRPGPNIGTRLKTPVRKAVTG